MSIHFLLRKRLFPEEKAQTQIFRRNAVHSLYETGGVC